MQADVWEYVLVDVFSPRFLIAGCDYVVTKWAFERHVVCSRARAFWVLHEGITSLCHGIRCSCVQRLRVCIVSI
jgi:hypothetical protein